MTQSKATAEVFITAFRALPKKEQNYVLTAMVRDRQVRMDLMDLSIAQERSRQSVRPFRKFIESQPRTIR